MRPLTRDISFVDPRDADWFSPYHCQRLLDIRVLPDSKPHHVLHLLNSRLPQSLRIKLERWDVVEEPVPPSIHQRNQSVSLGSTKEISRESGRMEVPPLLWRGSKFISFSSVSTLLTQP